jgi:hypothetical protein
MKENNSDELFPIIKRGKKTEHEFHNALKKYKYKVNGEYFISEKLAKERRNELIAEYDRITFNEEEDALPPLNEKTIEDDCVLYSDDISAPDIDPVKNSTNATPENNNKPIYFEGYFKQSFYNKNVYISSDFVVNGVIYIVISNEIKERGFYQCYIRPMKKEGARGYIVLKNKFQRNIFKEKIEKRKFFANPKNRKLRLKKVNSSNEQKKNT